MAARRGHGEGTVYLRPDGRWCAQLRLDDSTRKTLYGRTQREAREKLLAARKAASEGLRIQGRGQFVASFVASWLEGVEASIRPKTFENYDLNVRRLVPHLGRVSLSQLSPEQIQACYGRLSASGLSARSVQQAHAVLHRALHQAVAWRLIGRNPADFVSPPRQARREMATLAIDQLRRLFETTRGDRLHALWVLLGTAGLRLGEALGLKWEDIDLERGRLVIKRALQDQRGRGKVFVEPKTNRSRRTIHLADVAVEALGEHRRRQTLYRLAAEQWEDQDLVFPSLTGGPMEGGLANKHLEAALRRAELPRIRVHDLRHTAASILLEAGAHPKVVQDLLGHSTITLTLDTYSHVTPALHADAADRVNRLFGGPAAGEGVRDV